MTSPVRRPAVGIAAVAVLAGCVSVDERDSKGIHIEGS